MTEKDSVNHWAAPALTAEIARFVSDTELAALDPTVVDQAKRSLVDALGVILAGAQEPAAALLRDHLDETAAKGPCTVLGTPDRLSAPAAALANGMAGHLLEFDDTQLSPSPDIVYGLLMHPTVPVLSAALATAEHVERSAGQPGQGDRGSVGGSQAGGSGRQLLVGVIVGVEVACKLAEAIDARHYLGGMHCTGTLGSLGAAAAAAKVLGLDAERISIALGIAASLAGGLRANFGTAMKPFHAGRAAENGVVAALLAERGLTASSTALESSSGFMQAMAGGWRPERIHERLGSPFTVADPGLAIKRYPCGTMIHPAMDLALDLVTAHDLRPADIRQVRVGLNSMAQRGLFYVDPADPTEARFCIPHCLAVTISDRQARFAQFSAERLADPQLRAFRDRIESHIDPACESLGYHRIGTKLTLELGDGSTLDGWAEVPRGHPERPLTDEELDDKFRDCTGSRLAPAAVDELLTRTRAIETLPSVATWATLA